MTLKKLIIPLTFIICLIILFFTANRKINIIEKQHVLLQANSNELINFLCISLNSQTLNNNKPINDVWLDKSQNLKLSNYMQHECLVLYFKEIHCLDCVKEILKSLVDYPDSIKDKLLIISSFSDDRSMREIIKPLSQIPSFNINEQDIGLFRSESPMLFVLDKELNCTCPFIPVKGLSEINSAYISGFVRKSTYIKN